MLTGTRFYGLPVCWTVVTERGKPALLADSFVTSLRDAIGRESAAPEAMAESVDYAPGGEVIVQEGELFAASYANGGANANL